MNILHIVYAHTWGGGEQYVYDFCQEEKRLGHKNIVVLDKKQLHMGKRFEEVAQVFFFPLKGIGKFLVWRKYLELIDDYHINILNCHSGTMVFVCGILKKLRRKLRLVIYKHNVTANRKDFYHHWVQKVADAFVCVSGLVYTLQSSTAYKQYRTKFHLIYNGINTSLLEPKKRTLHSVLRVGYAGRIVENKGIKVLLEAIKIINKHYSLPCELYLAGQGKLAFEMQCKNFIRQNNLSCHWQTFGTTNKSNFYNEIDIFVLPSLVKESFGLALCEAMYSGIPVITTNNGAQGEIVENYISGLLVRPNNATEIAQKIMEITRNPVKYQQMSQAGHSRIKNNFTVEIMTNKLNQLFAEISK